MGIAAMEMWSIKNRGNSCAVLRSLHRFDLRSYYPAVFALFLLFPGSSAAAIIADSNGSLWDLNLITNQSTLIGNIRVGAMFDIALDPTTGILYGVTGSGVLYSIDQATGAATRIGSTGASINALTFDNSGTLYASGGDRLFTVNLTNGLASRIGTTGFSSSGDLAFDSSGNLFMSASRWIGGDLLISLNISTGSGTAIGNTGFAEIFGLVYADGTLYGLTSAGETISIDPATGVGTYLSYNALNTFGADGYLGPAASSKVIKEIYPDKILASGKDEKLVINGYGFSESDEIVLTDLSDSAESYPQDDAWISADGTQIVLTANFSNMPSEWQVEISANGNTESVSAVFKTVSDIRGAPFLQFPLADLPECTDRKCSAFRTAISAVMDHSGTPLDINGPSVWYLHDNVVEAYTGEKGLRSEGWDGDEGQPAYMNSSSTPFRINGNYIGIRSSGPKYLNYDGHAGYDYPFGAPATIVAPADGYLFRAEKDLVNSASASSAWNKYRTFYILHKNGLSTWYLHADAFEPMLQNHFDGSEHLNEPIWVTAGDRLGTPGDYGLACPNGCIHLHFETRKGTNEVVDPYGACLWKECVARRLQPVLQMLLDAPE